MLIGSTVSPFMITEILHKWILTAFQGEQKTVVVVSGVCVCMCVRVCVCVCVSVCVVFFLD